MHTRRPSRKTTFPGISKHIIIMGLYFVCVTVNVSQISPKLLIVLLLWVLYVDGPIEDQSTYDIFYF